MKLHEQRDYYRELSGSRLLFIKELLTYVESDKFRHDLKYNMDSEDISFRLRQYLYAIEPRTHNRLGPKEQHAAKHGQASVSVSPIPICLADVGQAGPNRNSQDEVRRSVGFGKGPFSAANPGSSHTQT